MKKKIFTILIFLFLLFTFLKSSYIVNSRSIDITNKKTNFIFEEITKSELEPGDIAFKNPDLFPWPIDHCLIFVEYNQSSDLYCFIEANCHYGVQYRWANMDELKGNMWGPYARVKSANSIQKQNAIDFSKRQIGKEFQGEWNNKNYNPDDLENDSLSNEWYCSELLWAAYYNCNNPFPEEKPKNGYTYGDGIDLDRNGGKIVAPSDILLNFKHVKLFDLKERELEIKYKNNLRFLSFNTEFNKIFKNLHSILGMFNFWMKLQAIK